MEKLMKDASDKVEGIGLNVVVVMSDIGGNFQSLANHLGVTPERPWFIHNNNKYFLMFPSTTPTQLSPQHPNEVFIQVWQLHC